MSSPLRPVSSARCLALVAALSLGLPGGIGLATETPGAGEQASTGTGQPLAELVELDEVWARGKSLKRQIEEAEDAFFARYNELNTNDSYDVHCGDVVLSRFSMILTRTCVPGFLANQWMSRRYSRAGGGDYTPRVAMAVPTCYGTPSFDSGSVYFEGGCYGSPSGFTGGSSNFGSYYGGVGGDWDSYYASFGGMGAVSDRQVNASMVQLEAVHRRQEYADTVLAVIQGDPQLLGMAQELVLLYGDMELTQQRFRHAREVRSEARPRSLGPRVPAPRKQ